MIGYSHTKLPILGYIVHIAIAIYSYGYSLARRHNNRGGYDNDVASYKILHGSVGWKCIC